jgi:hypothetical protein
VVAWEADDTRVWGSGELLHAASKVVRARTRGMNLRTMRGSLSNIGEDGGRCGRYVVGVLDTNARSLEHDGGS